MANKRHYFKIKGRCIQLLPFILFHSKYRIIFA
nr:MAG TPA: hypothetical protein [Caudoviricetes sp.]